MKFISRKSQFVFFIFLLISIRTLSQNTIEGLIRDGITNESVPGATILVKGTNIAVNSDSLGWFKITTLQNLPFTLTILSIGYKNVEIEIYEVPVSPLEIKLKNDNFLNEIVTVGYTTQERKNLVGAVTKINANETKQIAVAGFDAQLQGKAAGLQVSSNTGTPGDGTFIRIRGTTSINGDNNPLYIVDGVFINNTSLQTINTGGRATSPIADINPADIESIEVLKDASATAIYGARGANGVIIVTTKKGNYNSKPIISFNTSQGVAWQPSALQWKLTTGPEHAMLVNELWANTWAEQVAKGDTLNASKKYYYKYKPFRALTDNPNPANGGIAPRGLPEEQGTYNRLDKLFRIGNLSNYDLSLQGGSKSTRYYLGGSYTRQEATVKPIYFERASLKLNLDQKISENISFGTSIGLYRSFRNQARAGDGPQGGLFQSAQQTPTYLPEYAPDGTPLKQANFDNIDALLSNYNVNTISLRTIDNLYLDALLLPGLKFRSSWSVDYNNYNESEYWNSFTLIGASGGSATSSITQSSTWINEQTLLYTAKLSSKHALDALIGNTIQGNLNTNTTTTGSNFPSDAYTEISAAATRSATQTWTKNRLASFFGRVQYNYAAKYFVESSIRADGSSRFGENNRYGYFPSLGAAWRLKEERFFKDVNWLSDLKFRASMGLTGNQNGINDFASQGLWSSGVSYPTTTGGTPQPGTIPSQIANPNLKWEKTLQKNIGIDAAFFDGRLIVELNYYDKYTSDVLLQQPVPSISGYTSYFANTGAVSNKGYEVAINSSNIKHKNFSWNTVFTISGNKNKIEKLDVPINYYTRDWVRLQEGYSMYSFWMYKQLYVDPQTGNAVFQYADGTAGIHPTAADRQIVGSAMPVFFGGLSNSLKYKSFDLACAFTFSYGNKVFNMNRFFGEGGGNRDASRVIFASQLDRWTTPGQLTDTPRLTAYGANYTAGAGGVAGGLDQNSRFVEDGSFIKLNNLSFGFTLPKKLISKARLTLLRVYIIGSNLRIFKTYSGPDPESNVSANQNTQGLDQGTPPQPRTLQLGINITL